MLKKLLRSVREYKKDSLRTPFFVILEVVMEVMIPFLWRALSMWEWLMQTCPIFFV